MYRTLQNSATSPHWHQQRTRATRSNPGIAPDAASSTSTSFTPQRDIHSAPAQAASQDDAPQFARFYSNSSYLPPPFVHDHTTTPSEIAANRLRDLQKRFLRANIQEIWDEEEQVSKMEVVGLNRLDRRVVVDIYDQALVALGKAPSKHEQIVAECTRKTRVVLGLTTAEPEDGVFHPGGQLLKPLEPQYAEPRIEHAEDDCGYRAQWRLNAWRREGWPRMYPLNAIKNEAEDADEKLVGRDAISDARLMIKMHEDESMWEEGDVQIEVTPTEQAKKQKNMVAEKPQKVQKKSMMTVMQPRQKVMESLSARPHHEPTSSSAGRTTTGKRPSNSKKSSTYRRIVVKSTPKKKKKKRHAKAGPDWEMEISETSETSSSSDEDDEVEESEDDDEDE